MLGFQHIGRYKIIEELGRGGMGVVYLAEDPNLQRPVAIKTLPRTKKESHKQARERFLREARVSARLDHPFVIHIYDVDNEEDTDFIVMEYVTGQTLRDLIEERDYDAPPDADEMARLFWEMCQGVDYAHRMHIVHRDIKPENVMVTDDHHVKLMDFGLARQDEQKTLTQKGAVMGTIAYFAPEMAKGERADERSDIYSLGAVLFEMLTNHLPFEAEGAAEMIQMHVSAPPPTPRTYVPTTHPILDKIVLKCLQKSRDQRYQTVSELLSELESYMTARHIPYEQLRGGTAQQQEQRRHPSGERHTAVMPPTLSMAPDSEASVSQTATDAFAAPPALIPPTLTLHDPSDGPVEKPRAGPPLPAALTPPFTQQGPGAGGQIASDAWLKEAKEDSSWGQYGEIVSRLQKDKALRSHLRQGDSAPLDVIECKRCSAVNDGDLKYCRECGGLLVANSVRLLSEAKELADRGKEEFREHRYPQAKQYFSDALERDAKNFHALYYSGRIDLVEGRPQEATDRFLAAAQSNPRDPRPHLYLADIYRESGKKDNAIAELRIAVRITPSDPDTRCRLAFMLANSGRVSEAIEEYTQAVHMAPEHVEAWSELEIIYAAQDQADDAISAFEAVIRLDPQNEMAFRWLGKLYTKRNRYSHAERAYQTALTLQPNDSELYAQLGSLYESQRKEDQALKVLRQSIQLDGGNLEARTRLANLYLKHKQPAMAIQELEQAVAYHPAAPQLHRQLGELYLSQSELDLALHHFEQAVSLDPMAAAAHSNLGQVYLKKDYDANAVAHYQQAVSLEPYNPNYHEELGMAYYSQKRIDMALHELRKATLLSSANVDYHKALGVICEDAGRLDEAVVAFKRAIEIAPRDALARGMLGKVFMRQGMVNFALTEFQRALELEPNDLLLNIYAARAFSQVKNPDQAVKHFRRAIELGGGEMRESSRFMARSYQDLAQAFLDSAQYRKAAEVLDASLAVLPDDPRGVLYRGMAALGLGDHRRALEFLTRAQALEPQNPEVLASLARLYGETGDTAKSLRTWQTTCKMAPNKVEYMEGLAEALARQKQYGEAFDVLTVVMRMRPNRTDHYHALMAGWHLELNQLDQAAASFQQAINYGSREWKHYRSLARVLQQLGKGRDAAAALEQGVALADDATDRSSLEAELQRLRRTLR